MIYLKGGEPGGLAYDHLTISGHKARMRAAPSICLLNPAALLGACTQAAVTALDASSPAHCIAAFNVAAVLGSRAGDTNLQLQSIARGLFEAEKLEIPEAIAKAKGESLKLARSRLVDDLDAAQRLAVDCASRQDSDPRFKARVPDLLVRGREWKPPV